MHSSPQQPIRIPGYNLDMPSEAEARNALERVFGANRGWDMWQEACRAAEVTAGRVQTAPDLKRVVDALAQRGGATGVVARSIEIRMRTYARLASKASMEAGGQT